MAGGWPRPRCLRTSQPTTTWMKQAPAATQKKKTRKGSCWHPGEDHEPTLMKKAEALEGGRGPLGPARSSRHLVTWGMVMLIAATSSSRLCVKSNQDCTARSRRRGQPTPKPLALLRPPWAE